MYERQSPAREVRLQPPVQENIDLVKRDSPPLYFEAYQGLLWLLARNPEIGIPCLDKYIYVQGSDELANTPQIAVLYDYDDKTVTIWVILFIDPRDIDFTP